MMRLTRILLACALGVFLSASNSRAQVGAVPITDVSKRAHVTVNGGAMVLTTGQDWSGASLGGTLLYNLHPKFSMFAGYDHGFPINDVDEHLDLYRLVGSLRVHPDAGVGFGYGWFSEGIEGGLAQLMITKRVAPRLHLNGMYAHVFSRGGLDDFEYARVFLNYHLLGSRPKAN
jgi:hypothetical protein